MNRRKLNAQPFTSTLETRRLLSHDRGDDGWNAPNHSIRIKRMSYNDCSVSAQRTYTVEQIAEILGVSIRKAYYICETTNDFKVIRLGRRCLRIHKESFDQWLDGANRGPEQAPERNSNNGNLQSKGDLT